MIPIFKPCNKCLAKTICNKTCQPLMDYKKHNGLITGIITSTILIFGVFITQIIQSKPYSFLYIFSSSIVIAGLIVWVMESRLNEK